MKILIAADYYPVRRAEDKLYNNEFDFLLGEIKPYVKDADYSIINYESTFYGNGKAIPKFGPSMATDERSVKLAKWCGFDCFTLGNNHIHDYGDEGLRQLLHCLKINKIDYVGAGVNLAEAERTLYKTIQGKKVAFLNCCEHEFNIANEEHGGANPLNVVRQYYAIMEAKKNSDYVIIIVHGGSIGCQLPSPRMQELYRFFVDAGADAVINHHQHCFSGYEYYKGHPIVYGLGNLLFDKPWLKKSSWVHGYFVNLVINDKIELEIIPYTQCAETPNVIIKKGKDKDDFFSLLSELNRIIDNPMLLKEKYLEWIDNNEKILLDAVGHFSKNRYVAALQKRGFLPLLKLTSIGLLNYVYCEAHLDRLQRFLKKKYGVQ